LRTGKEIIELLKELNEEKGVTIISATHDLKMIDVSDRVIWIRDGQISRIEDRSKIRVEAALEVEEALMEGELPDIP
jgi:putative ABC transport system ATP-binding protein